MTTTPPPPFCVDCAHCVVEHDGFIDSPGTHLCRRPVAPKIDLVTGISTRQQLNTGCYEERSSIFITSRCGPEGKFFTPSEPSQ